LVSVTVLVTTALSVNAMRDKANKKSTAALQEARKALLGYALNANPVGLLPCPDNNGDGIGDISGLGNWSNHSVVGVVCIYAKCLGSDYQYLDSRFC
jgi:hypothetical protein